MGTYCILIKMPILRIFGGANIRNVCVLNPILVAFGHLFLPKKCGGGDGHLLKRGHLLE